MFNLNKSFFNTLASVDTDIAYKRQFLAKILSLSQFIFAFAFTLYFTIKDQNLAFAGMLIPFILLMLAPNLWTPQFGEFKYSVYIYIFSSFVSIISVDIYLGPQTNAHLLAFLIFLTALLTLGEEQKKIIFISFALTILAFIAPTMNAYSPFASTLPMTESHAKIIRFLLELTIFFLLIFKLYLLKILLDAETNKAYLKSEQASSELDRKQYLLKILSHDIKSPIANSLRGIEALIQKTDQKADLINIKNSQIAFKELIDNISSYNFEMSTITNIHKDIITLNDIFVRLKPLIDSRLVGKSISLNITNDIHFKMELFINADTLIYQILGNIFSNCIKFSEPHTTICVFAEKINKHLVLSIQDQGLGISPQALENKKHTTKGTWGEKGSGIGIEIIQNFCNLNNVTVEFISNAINPDYTTRGTLTKLHIPLFN